MPELSPGQQWEVDSSLVDPEGLVAAGHRRDGRNGAKRTAGPGIAAVARRFPSAWSRTRRSPRPLGVDSEWIASRTGIHRRRRVTGESLVDLAAGAGSRALSLAGSDPAELDLVLVATFTPDQLQPHAAPLVAEPTGRGAQRGRWTSAPPARASSRPSRSRAAQLESGRARAALVVGAEVLSRVTDYDDRRTAGLFGDGAGAAVLTPGGPGRIGPIALRSDGSRAELIQASHEERLVRMDGRATFRAAVAAMSDITQRGRLRRRPRARGDRPLRLPPGELADHLRGRGAARGCRPTA